MLSGTPVRMVRPCATSRPSPTVILGVTVISLSLSGSLARTANSGRHALEYIYSFLY
jgi:hypothetical protein